MGSGESNKKREEKDLTAEAQRTLRVHGEIVEESTLRV